MSQRRQVMIVDDDDAICEFLRVFLDSLGYRSIRASNSEQAVQYYNAERPDAVIMDVIMPGSMDGLGALAAFKAIDRDVPVIVLSGQGRTTTVVQAMKLGAFDFISKPFDEADLDALLADALRQRRVNRDVSALRSRPPSLETQPMVLGDGAEMRDVKDLIARVASTDVTVLIRGESGTGKELVARALHGSSARRDQPFVKVTCAALPFEFANKGTMFLDDVGELAFPLQARLLQMLQDGEFMLGGKQDVRVDVRVISATNRDLAKACADGQFRGDLFFRLNVVSIDLPPLRSRRDEIPVLTEYFLRKYSTEYARPYSDVSPDTMQMFMAYAWPGNIRELQNLVRRIVVLGTESPVRKEIGTVLQGEARPVPIAVAAVPADAAAADTSTSLKDISRIAAREAENVLILRMLHRTRWNRKETAHILGISYKALLYKIKDAGLDKAPTP